MSWAVKLKMGEVTGSMLLTGTTEVLYVSKRFLLLFIILDELIDTVTMVYFISKTGCRRYFGLVVSVISNLMIACLLLIFMYAAEVTYSNLKADEQKEIFTDLVSFMIEGLCIAIYNLVQVKTRGGVFCYKFRCYILLICVVVFL